MAWLYIDSVERVRKDLDHASVCATENSKRLNSKLMIF